MCCLLYTSHVTIEHLRVTFQTFFGKTIIVIPRTHFLYHRTYIHIARQLSGIFMTGVSPVTLDDLTSGFNIGWNISTKHQFNICLLYTSSYCGGAYISNYNQYGKVYRVMMQASPEYRLDEQALNNMFVRNGTQMAPVSQFVTLKQVLGPETANRFNLYSTITANVNPADGYSSGEVQKVIE